MTLRIAVFAVPALLLAACDAAENSAPANPAPTSQPTAIATDPAPPAQPAFRSPVALPSPRPPLAANRLVLAQWRKAENRRRCAPLGFTQGAFAEDTARPANFSGGWAVAFDRPGLRSAYGLAGTGLIDADDAAPREQRERIERQWPYVTTLSALPQPAYAGYGLEGAQPYPAGSDGAGRQSAAYLRVGGQACLYNIWSRLGRAHLEVLLDGLRTIPAR